MWGWNREEQEVREKDTRRDGVIDELGFAQTHKPSYCAHTMHVGQSKASMARVHGQQQSQCCPRTVGPMHPLVNRHAVSVHSLCAGLAWSKGY